jgi:hypothetical protein
LLDFFLSPFFFLCSPSLLRSLPLFFVLGVAWVDGLGVVVGLRFADLGVVVGLGFWISARWWVLGLGVVVGLGLGLPISAWWVLGLGS